MIGRRMYGGTSTYIPLKVNQAGVIPVIFASSLLYLPQLLTNLRTTTTGAVTPVHQDLPDRPEQPGLPRGLLRADRLLHLLLRGDHLQPGGGQRQHEEATAASSRASAPAAPPPSTWTTSCRASPCPASLYLGLVAVLPYLFLFGLTGSGRTRLPVRRHRDPDHRRSGPGDGEADRDAAHAPQLRRLPPLVRLVLVGPPEPARAPRPSSSPSTWACPQICTGDIFRANVSGQTAARPAGQGLHGPRRPGPRRRHHRRWSATGCASPTPAGLPARRLPAHGAAGRGLDDMLRELA